MATTFLDGLCAVASSRSAEAEAVHRATCVSEFLRHDPQGARGAISDPGDPPPRPPPAHPIFFAALRAVRGPGTDPGPESGSPLGVGRSRVGDNDI